MISNVNKNEVVESICVGLPVLSFQFISWYTKFDKTSSLKFYSCGFIKRHTVLQTTMNIELKRLNYLLRKEYT